MEKKDVVKKNWKFNNRHDQFLKKCKMQNILIVFFSVIFLIGEFIF